jgi:SAM-dependent methyltransferase
MNPLRSIKRFTRIVALVRWINFVVRSFSSLTHRFQFLVEWAVDNPEYFDHNIDLYSSWKQSRESFPLERGVFSSFAMTPNSVVLDLCCGDGFNSYYFYSLRAASVTAIDFDREAIRWAKRNYKARNLIFNFGDIRTDIPDGPFNNIVWDAAVEHFTESEIGSIMERIKAVLDPNGTLSGYTIVEPADGSKHLHQHEYEFHSKEDLARFLSPHFKNVHIFETTFPSRTNLYFYASNAILPFDRESTLLIRHEI